MFGIIRAFRKSRTELVIVALASLLAGCAVSSPAMIHESAGNASGIQTVTFILGEGETDLRKNFKQSLYSAFRERGVTAQEDAATIGDFAVAAMPADMSLASTNTRVSNPTGPNDVQERSTSRTRSLLDSCEAVRFRASLVLFNRETGKRLYRAGSEAFGCEGDPVPLEELADVLVRNSLLAQ